LKIGEWVVVSDHPERQHLVVRVDLNGVYLSCSVEGQRYAECDLVRRRPHATASSRFIGADRSRTPPDTTDGHTGEAMLCKQCVSEMLTRVVRA